MANVIIYCDAKKFKDKNIFSAHLRNCRDKNASAFCLNRDFNYFCGKNKSYNLNNINE